MSGVNPNSDPKPNPYTAPTLLSDTPPRPELIRVDGDRLVIASGAMLPPRCIFTGEPAPEANRVYKSLKWTPQFRLVIRAKRCDVSYCTGETWRRSRRRRLWIINVVGFCATLIAVFVGHLVPWLIVVFCVGLLAVNTEPLSVVREYGGYFWIRGCGPAFLDVCKREYGAF